MIEAPLAIGPEATIAPATPIPKASVRAAIEDVRLYGCGIVEGAMSREEAASIRERLWSLHRYNESVGFRDVVKADNDDKNIRLLSLINDDLFFGELAIRDVVLEAVRNVIGEKFLLSNYSANITGPGSVPMMLHADQGFVAEPWPPQPLGVNIGWMIDDFDEDTGATQVATGSGQSTANPRPDTKPDLKPLIAPAGSMLIMDGRTWHTSGPNRTADRYRAGIFGFYVVPWIRTTVNWNDELHPETVRQLSPKLLEIMGYHSGNRMFQVNRRPGEPPPPFSIELARHAAPTAL